MIREEKNGFLICSFEGLTTKELYEILRARADVFVGEEKILYPDVDGIDYESLHVFAKDAAGSVIAYLRMFPKADEKNVVQMGRVLTRVHHQGTGKKLLNIAIDAAHEYLGADEIYLESQKHAQCFYENSGFTTVSKDFIEAGIPHVKMRKKL